MHIDARLAYTTTMQSPSGASGSSPPGRQTVKVHQMHFCGCWSVDQSESSWLNNEWMFYCVDKGSKAVRVQMFEYYHHISPFPGVVEPYFSPFTPHPARNGVATTAKAGPPTRNGNSGRNPAAQLHQMSDSDSSRSSAEEQRHRLHIALLGLVRSPPTKLRPQTYAQISSLLDNVHFKSMFGFTISEFESIHSALRLPDPVRASSNNVVDSKTGLLMLLAWLRGALLRTLEGQFGWGTARTSMTVSYICDRVYLCWGHLLDVMSVRHHMMNPRRLDNYAAAIKRKTKMPGFWGAIDGTVRPIAMPDKGEKFTYNGHKRLHALKWQFISTPDGLIFLNGPYDGNRHDARMVIESLLVQWAEVNAKGEDGKQRYLYGNQAYGTSAAIISPFRGNLIDSRQEAFNRIMSKYRTTREWSIGMVSMQWRRLRDKQWQRMGLIQVGKDFAVSTILWNSRTCLVGNQISISMGCNPPTIEEYFAGPRVQQRFVLPDPTIPDRGINSETHTNSSDEAEIEEGL